jgi:uncharacterized protein (UPF0261 family)
MSTQPAILVVGTADTKAAEIGYLCRRIEAAGAVAHVMDVGVLAPAAFAPAISNREVAAAAGVTLEALAQGGDENAAMLAMARGAARLAQQLHDDGRIQGLLAIGGTMGTDLALDVAAALPPGAPKLIVSTVAYSHLIPPERIAPDLMMILWTGGLFGLNPLCESVLSQAAGAVVGACRHALAPAFERPVVGMTSLGSSCLSYMAPLKQALSARGYDVAIFHTTGMGGRAFEDLAAKGRFVAVLDLSLQEVSNAIHGSVVTSGQGRLEGAGRSGVPQIVAPGATDMVDFPTWEPGGSWDAGQPQHAHNRLISSVTTTPEQRRATARAIAAKLASATGPTCMVLPLGGIEEWDRPGQPLHDAAGLWAFMDELRAQLIPNVERVEIDAHINDAPFAETVLRVFDSWVQQGLIPRGTP